MTISTSIKIPRADRDPGVIGQILRNLLLEKLTLILTILLGLMVMVAILAPWISPYDPLKQNILLINAGPSPQHWLGNDGLGRDVLTRIIYGARTSLLLGVISPLVAALVGTTLGVMGGYFGGWFDRIVGRVVDMLLAFPALLLGILVAAALSASFWSMVAVLAFAFAPRFARIARASTLAIRSEPFIDAAIASAVGPAAIVAKHILPNIVGPLVVVATLTVGNAIRLESTLSFIGLGTQAPNPSWGNIIRDGLTNMFGSPWPIIGAGVCLTLTVLAFNLLGDVVRDVLDPETRA